MLAEENRARRFLDLTGLTPETLRQGVNDIATHGAVLDYLAAFEPDLLAAADALEIEPDRLTAARKELAR